MGQRGCPGDHNYVVRDLGAGVARLECTKCDSVVIDLDAAKDGATTVTVPGLFGPAKPTIFSVLAEEQRAKREEEGRGRHPGAHRFSPGGSYRHDTD